MKKINTYIIILGSIFFIISIIFIAISETQKENIYACFLLGLSIFVINLYFIIKKDKR